MRLRLLRRLVTYVVLILYVLIPMLDSMVCADCLGNAPFQGEAAIGHLRVFHDDVTYTSHDVTQSKTPDDQAATSFCSICANFLMGVQVLSPQVHFSVAHWDSPCVLPVFSELHYAINKPPQNLVA
jgi:hypothetical protein